ncbi:Hypothetical predicted protein [Xyrichtys novacula]|uniref:Uncharacterized protein n=1 Tax=Xyrichtys novacula TaxID=13765 RepID=A0AAV1FFI0_XYRNO|nr:Hypothetical predicted protein [Xyrichtys novacula]
MRRERERESSGTRVCSSLLPSSGQQGALQRSGARGTKEEGMNNGETTAESNNSHRAEITLLSGPPACLSFKCLTGRQQHPHIPLKPIPRCRAVNPCQRVPAGVRAATRASPPLHLLSPVPSRTTPSPTKTTSSTRSTSKPEERHSSDF